MTVEAFGMLWPTKLLIFFMFFFTIPCSFPFPPSLPNAPAGLGCASAELSTFGGGAAAGGACGLPSCCFSDDEAEPLRRSVQKRHNGKLGK